MSSRGAFGAPTQKHKSQNVNSVFSGKNTSAGKASGPSKHGGLQALGRTSTIVRRMPKPATLPSLKAEHGQDPQVCLVPQGGQGWSKLEQQQHQSIDTKSDFGGLSAPTSAALSGPDLRPNWAKQSGPTGTQSPSTPFSASATGGFATNAGADASQIQSPTADYPPLAAFSSIKDDQKKTEELVDIQIPAVPTTGYIAASGPRVTDRKLPARYYGGPEISQRETGQKYDFLQKMAKLSLDSRDTPIQQQQASVDVDQKDPSTQIAASTAAADSKIRYNPASEAKHNSTTMSATATAAAGGADPLENDVYKRSASQAAAGGSYSQYAAADGRHLASSAQQSGRGATDLLVKAAADVQEQRNAAASRHGGYSADDGAAFVGVGATGDVDAALYDYTTTTTTMTSSSPLHGAGQQPQQQQHAAYPRQGPQQQTHNPGQSQSHGKARYDDADALMHQQHSSKHCHQHHHHQQHQSQIYKSGSAYSAQPQQSGGTNASYLASGTTGWGDQPTGGGRTIRQSLLSLHPQQQQQQQMRYRVDARHTNSESDGSGWNAPVGGFHVSTASSSSSSRRAAVGSTTSSNGGAYAQQASGWYTTNGGNASGGGAGGNTAGVGTYPPSLLSLETTADLTTGGVFPSASSATSSYHNNNNTNNYYPHNGPVTFYATVDEHLARQKALKPIGGSHRPVGAELSSASEADNHGGYKEFFDSDQRANLESDKAQWNRSNNFDGITRQNAYKKPSEPSTQQPPIRMLKRNDEKSAEYFAYHSTANISDAGIQNDMDVSSKEIIIHKKPLLAQKALIHADADAFSHFDEELGKKMSAHGPQNFALPDSQQNQHQQQKFNRAPGGGKSLHGNSQGTQQKQKANEPTNSLESDKISALPPENIWEKRKEERALAERKTGSQSKQRSQFDQHFPLMSEAVKPEANSGANLEGAKYATPSRDTSSSIKTNQEVRFFDQKSSGHARSGNSTTSGTTTTSYPQWNLPTADSQSHWDELATLNNNKLAPLTSSRSGNRQQRGCQEALMTLTQSTQQQQVYSGRREFVNSNAAAKRGGGGGGGGNSAGGAQRNQRGNSAKTHVAGASSIGINNGRSSASKHNANYAPQKSAENVLSAGNPDNAEQDNFSNMGEFHAEDYKIDTAEKNSKLTKSSKSSRIEKEPKDRSRRSANAIISGSGKRGGESNRRQAQGPSSLALQPVTGEANLAPTNGILLKSTDSPLNANVQMAGDAGPDIANVPRSSSNKTRRANNNNNNERRGVQTRNAGIGSTRRVASARQPRQNLHQSERAHSRGKTAAAQANGASAQRTNFAAGEASATRTKNTTASLADRSNQLKSPVISEGAADEWETASESSDFGRSEQAENVRRFNGTTSSANGGRTTTTTTTCTTRRTAVAGGGGGGASNGQMTDFDGSGQQQQQPIVANDNNKPPNQRQQQPRSIGQKNGKPVSHTFQSNVEFANNNNSNNNKLMNNNNNSGNVATTKNNNGKKRHADHNNTNSGNAFMNAQKKFARDGRKTLQNVFSVRDGLAGVDINDASVVIIDNQPDFSAQDGLNPSSESTAGDFEEVLSKRAKRLRVQQLEEERRQQARERERQERARTRRTRQQERRAERMSCRKAIGAKRNDLKIERTIVSTNSNYSAPNPQASPAPDNGDFSSGNRKSGANAFGGDDGVSPPQKPGIITGLDELVTMTTVWNSTLSAVKSATDSAPPAADAASAAAAASSRFGGVSIPSPIARPVPKSAAVSVSHESVNPSSTWSTTTTETANNVSDKVLEDVIAKEKFANFSAFDTSPLKDDNLKGCSVDALNAGGNENVMRAKSSSSRYDAMRRSCSPSGAQIGANNTDEERISAVLADMNKMLENSDHAQLQKKLDRIKDFWPGGNIPVGASSPPATSASNVAKVRPQSQTAAHSGADGAVDKNGATSRSMHAFAVPIGSSKFGPNFSDFSQGSIYASIGSTTPQSPSSSASFGNTLISFGSQIPSLYPIMFRGGSDFLHQPTGLMTATHPTNSPPMQHIVGQQSCGVIGTQRSSRLNSFVEPPLIVQTNGGASTTPWSNSTGFEFLNGINATPPPPISAPTPGSVIGCSSIPPPQVQQVSHIQQQQQSQFTPSLSMIGPPPAAIPMMALQQSNKITRYGQMKNGCIDAPPPIATMASLTLQGFTGAHTAQKQQTQFNPHPYSVPPPPIGPRSLVTRPPPPPPASYVCHHPPPPNSYHQSQPAPSIIAGAGSVFGTNSSLGKPPPVLNTPLLSAPPHFSSALSFVAPPPAHKHISSN